jgi:hypothetical protein
MSDEARNRLAAAQTTLLRALLAGAPAPAGFGPERLRVEAAALLAKRRRTVERIRPDLVDVLGARFPELFDTWATENPRRDGTSARADADEFAAWLAARGHLPRRPRWRRR